ncbi:MAG TPA: magnesium-translocating P-type ATPase [Thermodesulfovibrionales bacterium]|jgi:Mg2+-importing ATPase|nr:magnesium-translocating P-type ATPase [Thermodesulfovibrionales bacterium]
MFKFLYDFFMPSWIRSMASAPHARTEDEKRLLEVCSVPDVQALQMMGSNDRGLSTEDAEQLLEKYGRNEITQARRLNFLQDVLRRLKSPLVVQLLVIAVFSGIIGELKSAIIVSFMIVLSVGLSYVLDRRSSRAVEALGKRVQSRAVVLRDGKETELPLAELVPGDIVLLQAGSIVPADLRLLSARDFFVSQATLTGESMPVEKNAEVSGNGGRPLLEFGNACFQGTSVGSGTARGIVVNTGGRTFFGAIAERLSDRATETSFDLGVRSFTWLMIRFMIIMVSCCFMIVGLTKGNWLEALLFGVAVAVGLTPEMLPMIVTVNLAKGAISMSRKKVIVKRLSAIQNFGAIDILCTDKTGTLTQDRVILKKHVDVTGEESGSVLRYGYLNSYYQTGLRNLLDRAVLEHTEFEVERTCRLVDELPFDFQRRRMSVVVEFEGDHVLICKGAVEEVYACCKHYQLDGEIYPLIDMIRDDLFEEVARLNNEGYRCLAIAYREFLREQARFTVQDESALILLGYIAFLDPPKDSAARAVTLLQDTGVQVKILTGDNALVTGKICRDVGLKVHRIVSGEDLDRMSQEEFAKSVIEANVMVKLSPLQKERVIESLRQAGHVVGYMGDGINDAPALRAADVGISVDSAVDVAKESADIVLLEMSLLVLEDGILEGRKVFSNIIKYIRMGASSNFGNMFSVLGASYLLPFLPMQPVQILLNNLLYDFSQTGIPTDHVDEEQIARPRKWDIGNIKWFMIFIGPLSSIFDYATFALMWFVFNSRAFLDVAEGQAGREVHAQLFQTGWFVESLLTQTLIVHIIRTKRLPFIQSRASLPMTMTTLVVMAVGAWLPYSPFASTLGFVQLPLSYWGWIAAFLLMYSVLTHTVKKWFFKTFGGE